VRTEIENVHRNREYASKKEVMDYSMRQPIKNTSRVPAYLRGGKSTACCDFPCCILPIRGRPWRGWMSFCFFFCARKSKNNPQGKPCNKKSNIFIILDDEEKVH
jgi:hypothetical protein